MGVYAWLLFLLIVQTTWISALSKLPSLEHGVLNQSRNSAQHHQVLVRPAETNATLVRPRGDEQRRIPGGWFVSMKGRGKSGGLGGSNINHRPARQNQKNAASSLLKPATASSAVGCFSFGLIIIMLAALIF